MRWPSKTFRTALKSGTEGIRGSAQSPAKVIGSILSLEKMHFVGIQSLAVAVSGDDDRQANYRFGRGHGHHEDYNHLALHGAQRACEGNKCQVNRVQHEFNRHQDDNEVASDEDANDPNTKNHSAQHEVIMQGNHHSFVRRASMTAPTMATSRRIDATSKGNTKPLNRVSPSASGLPNRLSISLAGNP